MVEQIIVAPTAIAVVIKIPEVERDNMKSKVNTSSRYMVVLWENYEKRFYTPHLVSTEAQANKIANDFRRRRSRRADVIKLN